VLARRLQLLLAIELVLYAALSGWLAGTKGWSVAQALTGAAGVAIAWRAAFGVATYLVAWRHCSPTPQGFRLAPVALVPHVLRELGAITAVYCVLQPFERFAMGEPAPPRSGAERLPVLLVHGYVCNRAACWSLARALRRRGETVWAPTLEPVYGSIDAWVAPFGAAVDALREATGAGRVVVVAHSMGGLAARAYLRARGGEKVARLITVGTPHRGSEHARLGMGQNARQMEPGSAWLAALAAADESGTGVPFASIFTHHDNLVAPQTSGEHPAARNLPLAGVGHLTMLFSREVRGAIASELDAANRAP
jgi:triacylglycerol esterase/lipase EstA (alpha/beta hydrolase family)